MFAGRFRVYLFAVVLLALSLVGCQGVRDKIMRIVVIPKGLTHAFWQSILRGARRAAADLTAKGITTEIIWDGPLRENDSLAQIRIIDRHISQKVDGIVLAPQHSRTLASPVERAFNQGIPVVIIDSGLDPVAKDHFIKYVATDNENGGYLAAKHLIKVLREKDNKPSPNIVLFRYQLGSESTEKREQGFERYIDEEQKAGRLKITWVDKDHYAGATRDSALKEAMPLVGRLRGQIDGIFASNESATNGMLDALRSLGLNLKIRLMGFDSSEPLLNAVEAGDIEGLILQDPYKMGYLGVWTLAQYNQGFDVTGNPMIEPVTLVAGGLNPSDPLRLGAFGLQAIALDLEGRDRHRDDPRILGTGENVITLQNLHDVSTRELFDPALQEKRSIIQPIYLRRRVTK